MNNRAGDSFTNSNSADPVIIRFATASDRLAIEGLAGLDSARVPAGPTLIGERNQRPVVAVSLSNGHAIADPFIATADLLELVRLRAGQLSSSPSSRPLQGVLGRVRGRARKDRPIPRAAAAHERTPALPAAHA